MSRYTKAEAHECVDNCNKQLERLGSDRRLRMSGRYGYQGLDVFNTDGVCLYTAMTGTPKVCAAAAREFVGAVAYDVAMKLLREQFYIVK